MRNVSTRSRTGNQDIHYEGIDDLDHASDPVPSPQHRTRRKRWTRDDNIDLLRAYYRATNIERDRTGYRVRLHEEWTHSRPDFSRSSQQLADQLRSVLRRKVFSSAELEHLKSSISTEHQDPDANRESSPRNSRRLSQRRRRTRNSFIPNQDPDVTQEELQTLFQEFVLRYCGVEFQLRPKLPKIKYNIETKHTVGAINRILNQYLPESESLQHTCHLVYCAAATVCTYTGLKIGDRNHSADKQEIPPWRRRLEEKIKKLRKTIGLLHTYLNTERPSIRTRRAVNSIISAGKLRDRSKTGLRVFMDGLKQKIAALGCRLRRYNESEKRRTQNRLFSNNQKIFYRSLNDRYHDDCEELVDPDKMFNFWHGIWGNARHHKDAYWIKDEMNRVNTVPEMNPIHITEHQVKLVVASLGNWRTPGVDRIHAYWWKHLTNVHEILASQFQRAIQQPEIIPEFFTQGITYMIHKNRYINKPENFRPITCLPTVYKIFTSLIEKAISKHLEGHNIMAWEQNGGRKGSRGSKEWLIVDTVIGKQAYKNKRNISIAWIDYRKAFDSVPHSWLMKIMEIYKINPTIIEVLKHVMGKWKTTLTVNTPTKAYETKELMIRRGIFQGDGLSPLLFCMSINPLSYMLQSSGYGYQISSNPRVRISHLLYMDDLKCYANSPDQLKSLLMLVTSFSESICMEFGVDKCAVLHCKRGKTQNSEKLILIDETTSFSPLQLGETYKYLGIQQALKVDDTAMKNTIEAAFFRRLKTILKTELYAKNKITAMNLWVAPVLASTFGVLKWSHTDLESIDRKVRTSMTKYRIHHPHASMIRLYLPRESGGRALFNAVAAHESHMRGLQDFFEITRYHLLTAIKVADKNFSPLNLAGSRTPITCLNQEESILEWKAKALHGRYPSNLYGPDVDRKLSLSFLKNGELRAETEGFMIAIQDQQIATRNFRKIIMKEDLPNDLCRLCHAFPETIQHICSACTYLAPRHYLDRHNRVAGILHQEICKKESLLEELVPYYKYLPQTIVENDNLKVYWDTDIITDRNVGHNRPDIVVFYKRIKQAYLIDITIPLDENLRNSRNEKILKYQALSQEIKSIYSLDRVTVLPVVLTCNGLVDRTLKNALERLELPSPERIIATMQKSVVLSTCSIVRQVLNHD